MKKLKIFVLFVITAFCFYGCQSDDFETQEYNGKNSDVSNGSSEITEIDVENVDIVNEGVLAPESVAEIDKASTKISIKTAVPKLNVYLNNIYRGKSPLVITDLMEGYYNLSIELVSTENPLKHKIVTEHFLIEVKNGEAQNYYFGENIHENIHK